VSVSPSSLVWASISRCDRATSWSKRSIDEVSPAPDVQHWVGADAYPEADFRWGTATSSSTSYGTTSLDVFWKPMCGRAATASREAD
jgi:hypothetical protein